MDILIEQVSRLRINDADMDGLSDDLGQLHIHDPNVNDACIESLTEEFVQLRVHDQRQLDTVHSSSISDSTVHFAVDRCVIEYVDDSDDAKATARMNDFLSEYKPSCITSKFIPLAGGGLSDMRVEWIAVNRGMHTLDLQRPPLIEEMKISFKSSINSYSPQSRPHPGLSPTVLDELARAYNITSGKWLIFLGPDQVDNLWTKVVSLIWLQRKRGFAKVSVMKPAKRGTLNSGNTRTRSSQSHSCVISVYVGNYLNEDEVMELRADLRSIGVDRRISFKPDAYSHLGIYRNNEWGIPPSRYIL